MLDYGDDPQQFSAKVRELTGGKGVAAVYEGVGKSRLRPSAPSHLRASDVVIAHNRFDPFSSDNRVLETVPLLRSLREAPP